MLKNEWETALWIHEKCTVLWWGLQRQSGLISSVFIDSIERKEQ